MPRPRCTPGAASNRRSARASRTSSTRLRCRWGSGARCRPPCRSVFGHGPSSEAFLARSSPSPVPHAIYDRSSVSQVAYAHDGVHAPPKWTFLDYLWRVGVDFEELVLQYHLTLRDSSDSVLVRFVRRFGRFSAFFHASTRAEQPSADR